MIHLSSANAVQRRNDRHQEERPSLGSAVELEIGAAAVLSQGFILLGNECPAARKQRTAGCYSVMRRVSGSHGKDSRCLETVEPFLSYTGNEKESWFTVDCKGNDFLTVNPALI